MYNVHVKNAKKCHLVPKGRRDPQKQTSSKTKATDALLGTSTYISSSRKVQILEFQFFNLFLLLTKIS